MLVPTSEPGIGPVVAVAFPNNHKPIRVERFQGPVNVNSYWSEGSRDEYRLVDLATRRVLPLPTSHPAYDRLPSGDRCGNLELRELPPGVALVCGGTSRGKPATVRVMLNEENIVAMLPAPSVELTEGEYSALNIVCGMKGGYRQDEFARRGLGRYGAEHPAIVRLASLGFLTINKAGAIAATIEGRNARG